ncbi:hypothetical protein LB450_11910 [Psychroflexus sp. CAK1W]|uniref:hypothetical protein n=1 Tax=Psychroflexus curvus TaxID=2873595 RepID=UPI001CCD187E|nr:hypothetical protein [Psychroflexus curvus]MBZ9628809.1 hypothetical protein [Psychroflexus curvus]
MKKALYNILLIGIAILLIKIFAFGELSYQQHKIEFTVLMLIGLYFISRDYFNRKRQK